MCFVCGTLNSMSAGISPVMVTVVYSLFQTIPWNRTDTLQIYLIFAPIKSLFKFILNMKIQNLGT